MYLWMFYVVISSNIVVSLNLLYINATCQENKSLYK